MRLTPFEIQSIKQSVMKYFDEGSKVSLFGSRTDDNQKGGDIDLYIQTPSKDHLSERKIKFLIEIKSKIGEQKIDVIIAKDSSRLIEQEALKKGIQL